MNNKDAACETLHVLLIEDRKKDLLDFKHILNGLNLTYDSCTCEQTLPTFERLQPDIIICSFYPHKYDAYLEVLDTISKAHSTPIILLLQEKACYPTQLFTDINYKLFVETVGEEKIAQYLATLIADINQVKKSQQLTSTALNLDSSLFIKDKNKLLSIRVKDILWIEAFDNYTLIITAQQKLMLTSSFSKTLEQLPQPFFLRIHRSFAVQLSQIKRIEDNNVYILDKALPISKTYKDSLLEQLYIL